MVCTGSTTYLQHDTTVCWLEDRPPGAAPHGQVYYVMTQCCHPCPFAEALLGKFWLATCKRRVHAYACGFSAEPHPCWLTLTGPCVAVWMCTLVWRWYRSAAVVLALPWACGLSTATATMIAVSTCLPTHNSTAGWCGTSDATCALLCVGKHVDSAHSHGTTGVFGGCVCRSLNTLGGGERLSNTVTKFLGICLRHA